jgi:carboxypeptidase Q
MHRAEVAYVVTGVEVRFERRDVGRRLKDVARAGLIIEPVIGFRRLHTLPCLPVKTPGGFQVTKLRHVSLILLIILSTLPLGAIAQQPDEASRTAEAITGSVLVDGSSMKYLRGLSDGFGGRLTGSPAYNGAAEWAAAQFRAAGITNVRLEPFTLEHGWRRGSAYGRMIAPMDRPIHAESLGWAPSTPSGGVRGEVTALSDIAPEKIKAESDKIKGKIAMLDLSKIFAGGFDAFARLIAAIPLLKETGAVAVLVPDREANNVLNAFSLAWGTPISPLPMMQVGMEDAQLIQRLLEKGPVTLEFQCENQVTGPIQVNNVVAEIPGREKPDEWIIVGAHLDSWDYGTGAQDNGSGSAMVLEAARALAAMGRAPRRSIRFALWGGEEQGLLGSEAYVRAHAAELPRCVAVLNTDNGAGHPKGWKVEGRDDLREAMEPISKLLEGLGGGGLSTETSFDTDHGHFMLAGIPALDLWVDMQHYGEIHHKTSDTLDKVDAHNLASDSAIVAVTAFTIADSSSAIAPHIDHAAVGEILKKHKLDGFLKAVGVWKE